VRVELVANFSELSVFLFSDNVVVLNLLREEDFIHYFKALLAG
jgi:hypothetical protein